MKRWNLLIGMIIFSCAVILSYTHTLEMFDRTGYEGTLAHIGTVMCEVTFFLGAANVIWYKRKGEKVSRAARVTFVLGLLIILYSNITSGVALDGKPIDYWGIHEAVLIGILIPSILFVSELVIGRAWFKQQTVDQTDNETERTDNEHQTIEPNNGEQKVQEIKQEVFEEQTSNNQMFEEDYIPNNQTNENRTVEGTENSQTNIKQFKTNKQVLKDLANKIKQDEGDYPSIRGFAEVAGISNYRSKKILDELKQKIS